jgi:flagellar protein FlaG
MEVRSVSQGGQTSIDFNKSTEKITQPVNNTTTEKIKYNDNNNVTDKEVKTAVDKLNKFLEDNKSHAEYEVHEKLNDIMIKIVDDKTGDVIQELPPKKILDMVAKMMEIVGVLFDKKA